MRIGLVAALTLFGFGQLVHAMPCDTGYMCKSKSGRYQIEVQHCHYTNDMNLISLKIGGKKVTDATLGAAYDGASVGGELTAFEVVLKAEDGASRVLSVEIPKAGKPGTIQSKYAAEEPEPYKIIRSEAITCEDEG